MSRVAEQRLLHAAIVKISREIQQIYSLNDLNKKLNEKRDANGKENEKTETEKTE